MYPTPYGQTASYGDRLRGALLLDPRTYRDIEQDTNANGQAALTVVLAALAAGIGALLGRDLVRNALGAAVSSIVEWVIFAFVAYFVGTSLFASARTSVTPGQVLRTIGFAQAPKFILVLGIIPLVGWLAGIVAFIWFILAAITALREAFEFDTGRAIGTGIVALIVIAIIDIILGVFLGLGSALFGGLWQALRFGF